LVDEVVEPSLPHVADVHVRTLADRLEALEDLDVVGSVLLDPVPVLGPEGLLGGFQGVPRSFL
ncbi:MAG TPA: hypothetical protein VIV57_26340, partial [Anaeromyxobacter sp.]